MDIELTSPIEATFADDLRDGAEALAWCGQRIVRDLLEQAGLTGVPAVDDAA